MSDAYNKFAQVNTIDLHGQRATFLRGGGMLTTSEKLRALRERSRASVRTVARYLEFDVHSRYAYYESPRFKGDLPLPLARRLAWFFQGAGIAPEEVMALAGLTPEEVKAEAQAVPKTTAIARPLRIFMEVNLPNEASLTRMFDALLESAGVEDPSGDAARTLALLLPGALAGTTGEFAGESLDQDFRPSREARVRSNAKAQKRAPQA